MLYKKLFLNHRMGLDSIIFHTKHFEQKYVLTGSIHITMDRDLPHSIREVKFPYLSAFLRILHV